MSTLLQVDGLWKKYSRNLSASVRYAAQDILRNATGSAEAIRELRDTEFWALREVGFTLARGEVLAVLGHNGAGKSTLLKCIAGKLSADKGCIVRSGELGYLLEMSAGFAPSMTGRDNVSMRGRLMGRRGKELARYISEVEEFADIDEFFDSPVQFYSSGMKARLGFAVSSVIAPDILILDEVLAVGDLGFRMKCYSRIDELRKKCSVILVTHSMNHVARMANTTLLLEKGRVIFYGAPQKGIELYQDAGIGKKGKPSCFMPERINFSVVCGGYDLHQDESIAFGSRISIHGKNGSLVSISVSIILHEQAGGAIAEWNSKRNDFNVSPEQGFCADLGEQNLCPGYYNLAIIGFDGGGQQVFLSEPFFFRVTGEYLNSIRFQPLAKWEIINKS